MNDFLLFPALDYCERAKLVTSGQPFSHYFSVFMVFECAMKNASVGILFLLRSGQPLGSPPWRRSIIHLYIMTSAILRNSIEFIACNEDNDTRQPIAPICFAAIDMQIDWPSLIAKKPLYAKRVK